MRRLLRHSLIALCSAALHEPAYALATYEAVGALRDTGCCHGATGIAAGDIDGDGRDEIVFGSGDSQHPPTANHWSLLEFDGKRSLYQLRWQSPPYLPPVTSVNLVQAGQSGWLVLVGLSSGEVEVIDALTLARIGLLPATNQPILATAVADADNDGAPDIVIVTEAVTVLYDAETLEETARLPFGAPLLRIGNVDADDAVELVYSSGHVVEQAGTGTTLEWDYSNNGFGVDIELLDVDDDGIAEILATKGGGLRAFDAQTETTQWVRHTGKQILSFTVRDVARTRGPSFSCSATGMTASTSSTAGRCRARLSRRARDLDRIRR
ncbi:MAG TPA: hypothetical protein VEL28_12625 [Candidatus Binatia bacterium]|nr:hypothetical protein [Candidatus Binatia bacterium]